MFSTQKYTFTTPYLQFNQKVLEASIRWQKSKIDKKIDELLETSPKLLSLPLPESKYYPTDFALIHNRPDWLNSLVFHWAPINQVTCGDLSTFDNIILQNNPKLLKQVFGVSLGSVLTNTISSISNAEYLISDLLKQAEKQLNTIDQVIEDFKKPEALLALNNDLVRDISQSEFNLSQILFYSEKEVFDAAIYFIISKENQNLETLAKNFGSKALELITTDSKNLYDIAAISDNAEAILMLKNFNINYKAKPQLPVVASANLSPYHYAINQPSLKTLTALFQAEIPFPLTPSLTTKDIKNTNFNPFQLAVLRAYLRDPLPSNRSLFLNFLHLSSAFTVLYLDSINAIPSELYYYTRFYTLLPVALQIIKSLQALFSKEEKRGFTEYNYMILFHILSVFLLFHGKDFIFSSFLNELPTYYESAVPQIIQQALPFLFLALTVPKLIYNFNAYKSTFSFRPIRTFIAATFNLGSTALYIKNLLAGYFSPQAHKEEKNIFSEDSTFKQTSTTSSTNSKKSLAEYQIFSRCAKKDTGTSALNCLKTYNVLELNGINPNWMSKKDKRNALKEVFRTIHPDKCDQDSNYQKLCTELFIKINEALN